VTLGRSALRWRTTALAVLAVSAALASCEAAAQGFPSPATQAAGAGLGLSQSPGAETSLAGDGPQVTEADPFTTDAPGLQSGQIEMTTVSTRPTLVTGSSAGVQVRGLEPDDHLVVTLDGRDVSSAFKPITSRPGQASGIWEGLITGLWIGYHEVVAAATDALYGTRTVTLRIVDHSVDGPVISGPQQEPFVCRTSQSGLGPPIDTNCDAPTRYSWYVHELTGQWVQLPGPSAPLPFGTEYISVNGRQVPFVVRVESAVINRSITRIAVLADLSYWNHNLLYQFGESCGTGFEQGSNQATDVFGSISNISGSDIAGPFLDLTGHLAEGWMVAESTLTTFGVSCNPLTSAETLMMVKEHIIDSYGDVYHTISAGASGGAIQQYLVANNYPGLIDAGTPLLSFPDILSTAMTVSDCGLLDHAFAEDPGTWNIVRQDAVTGEDDPQVCADWVNLFLGDLDPSNCPSGIPASQVYNPKTNPSGVRCDLEDDDVNGLGRDSSGRALLALDNTGVQYGLEALRTGQITPAQFIELNRAVGGFDHDGAIVAKRNQMTATEAALLYQGGQITGQGAIAETPIIDQSIPVGDLVPQLDIHQQVWPYAMRARLAAAGDTTSQAIWSGAGIPADAIDVANIWLDQLDRLQAEHPLESRAALVTQSRPYAAHDQCRTPLTGIDGLCSNGVLRASNPRVEAGGPFSMDNIDCRLEPVRASYYPPSVTPADLVEIKTIFPSGVCDYAATPAGWTPHSKTWLSVGTETLQFPGVEVPYPLARSVVPKAAAGAGHPSGGPTPPPARATPPASSVVQLLYQLVGPPSAAADAIDATRRAASTVVDALP
jgi:hypothetical protein